MADKEILTRIKEIEQRRPAVVLDATMSLGIEVDPKIVADALDTLQASFTECADLYAAAKLKGAQSTYVVPLRHAAAEVGKVAAALRQPRPAADAPKLPKVQRCPGCEVATGPSAPHTWICGPGTTEAKCLGRSAPRDLTGLDQLIADSAAEGRGSLRAEATAQGLALDDAATHAAGEPVFTFPGQVSADEVTAYLKGEANTLPGLAEALVPGSVHDATGAASSVAVLDRPAPPTFGLGPIGPENDLGVFGVDEREQAPTVPQTWESDTMTADGHRPPGLVATLPPVPLLGQPGDAGGSFDPLYIPPGGVPFTFAELLAPVPAAALPPHLSHSQAETVGECPAKYRMQRLARSTAPDTVTELLPQIPQWALIGGNAFHAAVEGIEQRATLGTADPAEYDCDRGWQVHFGEAIAEVESTSPVPRALWRASKRGAEGETWWNANGPEMLRKYLAARPAEPTMVGQTGTPCIEAELTVEVPTGYGPLPFKAILDRATLILDAEAAPRIVIRDYKTGDRMPDSNDQLAEQAWTLIMHSGFPVDQIVPGAVLGTYYNARKGTWTTPVDLLAEYSYEWFVYKVTSAHAQRLALTTGPTPARKTSFCGGCSVKWACPVGGPNRSAPQR